jgi:hypothetical protein
MRSKHGNQEAPQACPSGFKEDVEAATVTVIVLHIQSWITFYLQRTGILEWSRGASNPHKQAVFVMSVRT